MAFLPASLPVPRGTTDASPDRPCCVVSPPAGVAGPPTPNTPGNWGLLNVPDPSNLPQWRGSHAIVAAQDKIFIFGGLHLLYRSSFDVTATSLADVWVYDPLSFTFTWIAGEDVESKPRYTGLGKAGGAPGLRFGIGTAAVFSGVDCVWLAAGAASGGYGSDLWCFSLSKRTWTW